MGEPVSILDLAKDTITLSGLKPFDDIDIVFSGMRPGEKLFEELQTTDENMIRTRHPKIFIGRLAVYPEEKMMHALDRLSLLATNGWDRELRKALSDLLPEAQLQGSRKELKEVTPVFQEAS
jgi:FlaA1/EpsC-like NDP-sugar epimerase